MDDTKECNVCNAASSSTDGCDSGPVQHQPAPVSDTERALLSQVVENEKLKGDFRQAYDGLRGQMQAGIDSQRTRLDYQHNRIITLECALKTVRRLTSDQEIAQVIRLALQDRSHYDQPKS